MKFFDKLPALLGENDCSQEWRGDCPLCGYTNTCVISIKHSLIVSVHCFVCTDWHSLKDAVSSMVGKQWVQLTKPNPITPAEAAAKIAKAKHFWESCGPLAGTPAEPYLAGRKVEHLLASTALQFHPAASHPTGIFLPALVALVGDVDGKLIGVQRTYLADDGDTKAAVVPQRANLGLVGGGSIRLFDADPTKPLVIGEGTETTASAGILYGGVPAWAAISLGNLEKTLMLPSEIQDVVIAADPDAPGIRAAFGASRRWRREGRKVSIIRPRDDGDFNDVLRAKGRETSND
jgi:putative DNA primase/helicase